jgi:outer membrane protein
VRKALLTFVALAVFLALPAATALAADLKIGVVDVEFIIQTSKKGKAAKAKLKKMVEDNQKQLDGAQNKLLDLKKAIESGTDMETPEKKRAKVVEYQQGLLKLQELFMTKQQELAKKEIELMKPILKSLEEILTALAKDGSYDLIMNRSEQGVLFTKQDYDITQKVLDKLNGG